MIVAAEFGDGVGKREALLAVDDVAQAFVGRAVVVGGGRGRGEPAFVDAAAVQAEGVEVFGWSLSRLPGWRNERGTQQGANRKSPPDSSSADSTIARTLPYCVLRSRTEVGAAVAMNKVLRCQPVVVNRRIGMIGR